MKRIPKTLALGVVSVVCALLLVACGNDHHKVTVTSIAVGPATATINAGGTQQYTAIESLSNGMTMDVTTQVTWNSSNPAAATINTSSGLATGVGSGTTTIMATLSGVNGTATLTVIGATKVTVTPITKTIMAGATFQFTATATIPAAGGGTTMQDVTQTATWSSSDMTIGTINSTGLATGVAMGSTTITASFEGATGTANLTVGTPVVIGLLITPANPTIAVGTTSSLSAVELISDGTTQPTTGAVTWVSSDTTKVTVGSTTGIAVGVAAGTSPVTVTASEAGTMFMGAPFMGTTTVTVQAAVARFAYLADAFSTTDDVFNVDATTTPYLTVSTVTPAATKLDIQLIVHPSGHFVYAIDGSNNVTVYNVDSTTGALTLGAGGGVTGNAGFGKGVIDPTGQFLFVINMGSSTPPVDGLYAFKIDQKTGALTVVLGSPFTANVSGPADVLVDPTSLFLYVVNNTGNTVSSYTIDPTSGVVAPLAANATIATGSSPEFSTLDPTGTRLYVPNNVGDTPTSTNSSISIYSIASGVLTQIGTNFEVIGSTSAGNVAIDPTNHIYVVDSLNSSSNVYGFSLNADGTIGAATTGSPYSLVTATSPTGGNPMGIAIDPTGTIVAVVNNFDSTVVVFPIQAGGVLGTASTVLTMNTNVSPQFIAFYSAVSGQ